MLPQKLKPKWEYLKEYYKTDLEIKQEQKVNLISDTLKSATTLSRDYAYTDAGRNMQEVQIDVNMISLELMTYF